jgi:hypothetical protein
MRHLDRIVTPDFACRVDGVPARLTLDESGAGFADRRIDWLDADDAFFAEHSIELRLPDGSSAVATHLGARYDECVRMIREFRGTARRPSLTSTSLDPIASFESRTVNADAHTSTIVDVLLFPHALLIEPRGGAGVTIPLPLVREVRRTGWTFAFGLRGLPGLEVGGLGARTDEFEERLQQARSDLAAATAAAYVALHADLGGLDAPDGWAVDAATAGGRADVLRRTWLSLGRAQSASWLADWAGPDGARFGLWTEGGTTSLPFLIAARGEGPTARVAVEAVDADDRATFVFATDDVDRLNAILILTAFRREALSLPADELGRWSAAVRTQAIVQAARGQLVARVTHDDGWAKAMEAALHADAGRLHPQQPG